MGVYIKGMVMPTDGSMIFAIRPDGMVEDVMGCYVGKAVPVQPHGDLIERDALMDDIISSMVFSGRNVPKEAAIVQKVLDIVGDTKAIIPAEEGET